MQKKGIAKLPIVMPNDKALEIFQLLSKINRTIGCLKSEFSHSIVNDAIVSMFSLNESVQSTRIEGTQVTFTDMVEECENKNPSWERVEVNNYRKALQEGTASIKSGYPISTRLIKDLHKMLMENARGTASSGGEFRKIQNFIGPNNKIEDAVYIPVAANEIEAYMENLDFFICVQRGRFFLDTLKPGGVFRLKKAILPTKKASLMINKSRFLSAPPMVKILLCTKQM